MPTSTASNPPLTCPHCGKKTLQSVAKKYGGRCGYCKRRMPVEPGVEAQAKAPGRSPFYPRGDV